MLSPQHRALIKATVPLLETDGSVLTGHFYNLLLTRYPQLLPLFNQAHLAKGDQARALANGVLMYARHIDQLGALGDLVTRIVNKHVALQIQPEHYPLVGECLLQAMEDVLGKDVATAQVLEAWGAAYGQLAVILIGAEQAAYDEKAAQLGGWRGGRAFSLVRKVVQSQEITSFYLEPVDGQPIVQAAPGQYIALRVTVDGVDHQRTYSLSSRVHDRQYRISVKREPGGTVSGYLHDTLMVGQSITLFPPSGDFVLREGSKPLVLISGGVGITPTLAMLEAALASARPIHFIHSARNAQVHAFRDTVDALAQRHPLLNVFYCYGEANDSGPQAHATGRLDQALLAQWLPADRDLDAYFLGPGGFMAAVKGYLAALGVPAEQCHSECFGPNLALA